MRRRWQDCPSECGPTTTVYNRRNRWSRRGIWARILAALTEDGWIAENRPNRQHWHLARWPDDEIPALIDVLGRPIRLAPTPGNTSDIKGADLLIGATAGMKRLIADRGYDADRLRSKLREQGTIPVIPGRRNRMWPIQYDGRRYRNRWLVEAMFCRLKDFRRIANRYDKLARNYQSAVAARCGRRVLPMNESGP